MIYHIPYKKRSFFFRNRLSTGHIFQLNFGSLRPLCETWNRLVQGPYSRCNLLSVALTIPLLFGNILLLIAARPHWFDSKSADIKKNKNCVFLFLELLIIIQMNTWMASTVLLSDSFTTLCFLASSSLYFPTSLTISFNFWAICN